MKYNMKRILVLWTFWLMAAMVTMGQVAGPAWDINSHLYEKDCVVFLTLTENGQLLPDDVASAFETGAIYTDQNGEETFRGIGVERYKSSGKMVIKMRVWSNAAEASDTCVVYAHSYKTGYYYKLKMAEPLTLGRDMIGSIKNPVEADIALSDDEYREYRFTEGRRWMCLYGKYEKDVEGYFRLEIPDSLRSTMFFMYDVGAFLPSTEPGQTVTCRGLTERFEDDEDIFPMRIWTDDDLTGITFKIFCETWPKVYSLVPTVPIDAKADRLGSIKAPIVLRVVADEPETPPAVLYRASFYDDAKQSVADVAFAAGEAITAPEAPTKVGHHFAGWQPAVPETMPARNMTFRASYAPNVYTVTFVGDGGVTLIAYELPYGSTITEVPDAKVTGKTFTGWDDATFRKGETIVTDHVTYTAQYRTDVYPLTYVIDGEEYMSTGLPYGAEVTLPTPQREGYTFAGWEGVPANGRMPAGGVVLTGHFTPNVHTLRFLLADGTVLSSALMPYGAEIVAPKVNVVGYTFTGWETVLAATMPDHDVTYTARPLTAVDYHLRYMISDGAGALSLFRDVILHYGDMVEGEALLPTLIIEGYDHTPWDWGTLDTATMTMPAEDVTVICLRTIHRHVASFVDGSESISTTTYDYGAVVEHPSDPQKEGYTFTGWSPQVEATMPDHDVTYEAQYTVNEHFVSFVDYNGRVISSIVMPFGAPIVVPAEAAEATMARRGYDFAGWLVGSDTTPVMSVESTMPDRNVTLTATYTEHKYTVRFVDAEGTLIVSYKMGYGSVINVSPEAPEKTGMIHAGWTPDFVAGHTAVTGDQTFTAVYKANPHALTYTIDGETFYTQWLVEGEDVVAPDVPQLTGYTFTGWTDLPAMMPNADVTVVGSYKVNLHVVTFYIEGQDPQSITYAYGDPIVSPIPQREGYTFTGWNISVEATMPDYDLDYTAVFTKNQYTVTFYDAPLSEGDQSVTPVINRQILTMGDAVARPADPTRKGYTFEGWTPAFTEGTLMATHDMSYAANYTPCTYRLTYLLNGEVYAERDYMYGRPLTCMPDVVEKGKTFSGWSYTPEAAYADEAHIFPATMPDHDVTIVGWLQAKTDVFATDDGILYAVKDDAEDAAELVGFDDEGVTAQGSARKQRVARLAAGGETLVLPAKVTDADGKAYTLTSIAAAAFRHADISAITIPETVTTIGEGALDSESLTSIRFEGETMPALKAGAFDTERVTVTADAVADADILQAVADLKFSNETLAEQAVKASEDDKAKVEQTFTVSASVVGGLAVSVEGTGTYRYGQTIMLSVPMREGYAVSYMVGDGEAVWGNSCILTADEDVSVTFAYSAKIYNVIYVIDEETVRTVPTAFGTSLTTSGVSAAERTGYTFQGWSAVPATMPAHDVFVAGAYKVNTYSFVVTIDDVEITRQTVPYSAALTIPEISKEGYTVVWEDELLEYMPAHDVMLSGRFVANTVTSVLNSMVTNSGTTIYNLSGQRVAEPRVQRSLYIVGGRKTICK